MTGNWFTTTDNYWFEKWDSLQKINNRGNFTQLSTWLMSYLPYGFKYELLLKTDGNDNIVCGSANIIVKALFFKIYVCSCGPFLVNESRELIEEFLIEFKRRAKKIHAFAAQIGLSEMADEKACEKNLYSSGIVFPKVASVTNENLIDILSHVDNNMLELENLINTFNPTGRRDVRASLRKGLILQKACHAEDIEKAYQCFQTNAGNKGYAIRDWNHIKASLIEAVSKNNAYILTAFYDGNLQGAVLTYVGGNTMTYVMGGVLRHKPDLLTGYFLQIEAMKLCAQLGIKYYNISSGGPKEVKDFKQKFNPVLKTYPGVYYTVNNKILFWLFKISYNTFSKHIPLIIRVLKRR